MSASPLATVQGRRSRRPNAIAALAVVGAGFGDEGKGAAVDRLARPDSTVVRFNGGAQAGHTVVTPDGRRHVFHHVGSGAFQGAPTWFSRHVVGSPMHLGPEIEALRRLGVVPVLSADPRGVLATPYDMLVNQIVEVVRSGARHGSCGYGVGEAVERSGSAFATTLADLGAPDRLAASVRAIRDLWVPERLARLGVSSSDVPEDYRDLLAGDAMVDAFMRSAAAFAVAVRRAPLEVPPGGVVFEGAQGLGLDQDRGAFPHVTRSNTGIRNILDVCRETGIRSVVARYVTRCYLTRHGAGPLPGEVHRPPVPGFSDATNVANPWQGSLRFAPLDVDDLTKRIRDDLSDATGSGIAVEPILVVTCLDQAGPSIPIRRGGRVVDVPTRAFAETLRRWTRIPRVESTWAAGREHHPGSLDHPGSPDHGFPLAALGARAFHPADRDRTAR